MIRFFLALVVVALVAATVWALLAKRVDAQRHDGETQNALRRTAEFLKPDTTSDLRFGKKATPSPSNP